jgi:lambda family phage tail tape measure protein
VSNEVLGQLPQKFSDLREKVAEGKATQEDFNAVLNLVNDASLSGIKGVSAFITELQKLMGQAVQTTQAVAVMANTIGAAAAMKSPARERAGGVTSDENASPFDDMLPTDGPRIQSRPLIELEGTPWIHEAKGAKGGGGGGSTKQTTTELQELNQALQALNEPFAQATTAYGTLQTALKNGTVDNDEYKASLEAIQEAFMAAGGSSDQWAQIMTTNGKKVADSSKEWSGLVKGFVSDLVGGLRQGKSLWESFGDAVNNVLDKIIDKLLNQFIDAIFTSNKAASGIGGGIGGGAGGGGFLGGILSWFGGLFSAKGNVFDGGVSGFAKGGSFTNSIISSPTAFAFGKGGSNLGIMGEAGPEAVMPLKRGPNGSLGVQMHGGGGAANQNNITIAPVINVEGSSGNEAQDQKQAARISEAVTDAVNKIVDERMLANTAYGGVMKPRGYGGN